MTARVRRGFALGIGGLGALWAVTGCIPSLKDVFADASYPAKVRTVPARDETLSVDATVFPTLVIGYERPIEAGRCIRELRADPTLPDRAWRYGGCLARGGSSPTCSPELPWVRVAEPPEPWALTGCVGALSSKADRIRLAFALSESAGALYGYGLATLGQNVVGRALPPALRNPYLSAVDHAGRVLAADPVRDRSAALPALALSGGAANGAFVAGYLHALLWSRERARALSTPARRAAIDQYRFGAVFGSSVGSLVALPLDLYFSDALPNGEQARALTACAAGTKSPTAAGERLAQACALRKLETDFVRSEWELLCAQPGSVLELLSPRSESILRFDPLEQNVLIPFLKSYQGLVLENAFTRTAMAVDMQQNALLGLDERACRLSGSPTAACLREGVLASIVEPVFVPARKRVYSGLRGPEGEGGTWLDGSIRSLNPAARAAMFTTGKVLALNTNRAGGVPSPPTSEPIPLLMSTFDALGAAARSWEIAYASAYQRYRDAQLCALAEHLHERELCAAPRAPTFADGSDGSLELTSNVLSVWVPDGIAPQALFASGYTFDPLVMRGLFLFGEREFLRSRQRMLGWLGWCAIATMEVDGKGCSENGVVPAFVQELAARAQSVEKELSGYARYSDLTLWQAHVNERRKLVKKKMQTCKKH